MLACAGMKVIHVETGRHLYGGAQQVLYLCEGLEKRGIDCLLVCPPDSAVNEAARERDIRVWNVPCRGELDFLFAWRLKRLFKRAEADLVHVHSRRGADVWGGSAAASAKTPVILSRRVDHVEPPAAAAWLYRPYDKIIAISQNVRGSLVESGVDDSRIEVIMSSVDIDRQRQLVDRERWLGEFGLPEDAVVIAMVAQFIERKGHRFLIEILPRLVARNPKVKVVFFGKGPLEEAARSHVTELGMLDSVRFAGFRHDVDSFLGHADLLVHPATGEGLGVTMLKAAAAGLPVVAFDVAGAQEAVLNGETGVLVHPGVAEDLLQAINELVENPDRRRQMGSAGHQRMQTLFSVDTMVNRHVDLYRLIVDGS